MPLPAFDVAHQIYDDLVIAAFDVVFMLCCWEYLDLDILVSDAYAHVHVGLSEWDIVDLRHAFVVPPFGSLPILVAWDLNLDLPSISPEDVFAF
jgi:hypothetical protein